MVSDTIDPPGAGTDDGGEGEANRSEGTVAGTEEDMEANDAEGGIVNVHGVPAGLGVGRGDKCVGCSGGFKGPASGTSSALGITARYSCASRAAAAVGGRTERTAEVHRRRQGKRTCRDLCAVDGTDLHLFHGGVEVQSTPLVTM